MNRRQFLASTAGVVGFVPLAQGMGDRQTNPQPENNESSTGKYPVSCSTPEDFNTTASSNGTTYSEKGEFSVGPADGPWGDRNVKLIDNITYHETPHGSLKLDLYLPWTDEWSPGMVYIHGGGWISGDKDGTGLGTMEQYAIRMATHGYVGANINYRLSTAVDFPKMTQDVNAAIKWLRQNAQKYNIDSEQIGVLGGSAGGHLAALAGVTDDNSRFQPSGYPADISSDVQAVVSHYGFYDWRTQRDPFFPRKYLGSHPEEVPKIAKAASPITHINSDDPPHFLTHGVADGTIPVSQAIKYRNALKAASVPVRAWFLMKGGHGATNEPPFLATSMKKTRKFLQSEMPLRELRDKKEEGGRMYNSCKEIMNAMN
jgi:acetyl esterase/lipase